jgi:hypothetical protein
MKKTILLILIISLILSCKDQFSVKSPIISLKIKKLDSLIAFQKKIDHVVEVKAQVNDLTFNWSDFSVSLRIMDGNSVVTEFNLKDDGLSDIDGDFLKGDHVFTGIFNDSILRHVGEFTFQFFATYQSDEITLEKGIEVVAIPEFSFHVTFSGDTIPEGTTLFGISLDSGDANALYDLSVRFLDTSAPQPIEKKSVFYQSIQFSSGIYNLIADSAFGAGLKGNFTLRFELSLQNLQTATDVLSHPVYVLNSPPEIISVQMPDSLKIPSEGTTPFDIFVKVNDKRGVQDVLRAFFKVKKPDGTYSGNGFEFELHDDGISPDQAEKDLIFSARFVVGNSNEQGTYIFEFQAEDKVNQKSQVFSFPIVLY